ncbi:YIP1 family protein [Bergeyella zoohelcum]|uniref:Yip1 domain-containing protein n=1 Tax=Bergeyella zoohelcum TaxID=1015 RepID=A0A376C2R1_9FLAO|nr:YIP1 family protein [Bergeyella zoohelcum]EKB58272.1 hypothetical protein HMPREF9700_02080 [Bergeyella zoohelcum CCUG 30536]SSZ55785.1 Uncharacterised protein [Bergeyella zoohelcum]
MNLAMVLFDSQMNGLLHIADDETNVLKNLQITNGVFFFNVLCFFALAKIINLKTRFIDVLNAFLIGLLPLAILVFFTNIPAIHRLNETVLDRAQHLEQLFSNLLEVIGFSISTLVALFFVVYAVTLMYNGFKTATHLKKGIYTAVFFALLFILNSITQAYF